MKQIKIGDRVYVLNDESKTVATVTDIVDGGVFDQSIYRLKFPTYLQWYGSSQVTKVDK